MCVCPSPADRRAIAIEKCIVCLGELCRGSSLPMKIDHYVNVGNLQTGFAQQRRRLQSVSPTRCTVRSLWWRFLTPSWWQRAADSRREEKKKKEDTIKMIESVLMRPHKRTKTFTFSIKPTSRHCALIGHLSALLSLLVCVFIVNELEWRA